ncbi:monovalent cation/H(+) antiporter subunit G [Pseudohalioglobus sediminis]|uniref:Monovalent cation/H(+) antiporter subunit G n=1 Tax=Pseudohalioglobus sediminis TaxID=2606449 RepID=A0A5B0WSP8_9GAMM|nr:monovalent cation/H(+) antiporter subunit G [Pseudohalioglobus sediminis]KAA1189508.1 monovalent cation/H(+) antiporter subunit G [Pseudohalioglobus sediminis]
MIDVVLDVISWVLLALGGACVLIGGIGGLRLPNFYTRIHAASLTDTMATLLIFTGMMLQSGFSLPTMKLFAIMLFLLLTGPTATYALANAALLSGMKPDSGVERDRGASGGVQ